MKNSFEILKVTHQNVLNAISGLSEEQLNKIPSGFSNNIMWNVAHIVVTQQLLCYGLSENEMCLGKEQLDENRKGSTPKTLYSSEEIEFWKSKLTEVATQIEKDYESGVFKKFTEYPTSYNITLTSIEKAIEFNNVHAALHLGCIMAMKKVI